MENTVDPRKVAAAEAEMIRTKLLPAYDAAIGQLYEARGAAVDQMQRLDGIARSSAAHYAKAEAEARAEKAQHDLDLEDWAVRS